MAIKKHHLLHDMTDKEAASWLYRKHWVEEITIKDLAVVVGIHRKNLSYWFDKLGVKRRNISEDNKRRYKHMTKEQIKAQTKKANDKTRELFKDEDFKIKRLRELQNARKEEDTSIELAVKEVLNKLGYKYEQQKAIGPWFADFYLPGYNLIVECDGDYWHNLEEVKKRDRRKNHYYWRNGYKYIRLKENEINKNVQEAFLKKFNKEVSKWIDINKTEA